MHMLRKVVKVQHFGIDAGDVGFQLIPDPRSAVGHRQFLPCRRIPVPRAATHQLPGSVTVSSRRPHVVVSVLIVKCDDLTSPSVGFIAARLCQTLRQRQPLASFFGLVSPLEFFRFRHHRDHHAVAPDIDSRDRLFIGRGGRLAV